MVSKKRQTSKKSIGSVSSDKSPESRSPLDGTGNTAADVLSEEFLPASNHSSTGPPISITHDSRNSSRGSIALSDYQTTVRTLPAHATWGMEADRDGTYNLPPAPPPTDIGTVSDSNAFPWPDFSTDIDGQFDFDIPFTGTHPSTSTTASSTALAELDMSHLYNRPTHGFDAAGCSGELMEYLSLGEKVSTNTAFLASRRGF